ncbi:MAG: hypothetical protein CVV27_03595, partial [Candidatus Melainabacteria bacterium HGW-Melainabacteria-1]
PLGGEVDRYLNAQLLPRPLAPKAMHYSQTAVRWRNNLPALYPAEYQAFCETLSRDALEASVEERLRTYFGNEDRYLGAPLPERLIQDTMSRLKAKDCLTESRKQLMFTYFKQFEALKPVALRREVQ